MNDALANDNDINEVPLQSHKKRDGSRSFFFLVNAFGRPYNVMSLLVQWLDIDTVQRYGCVAGNFTRPSSNTAKHCLHC